MIMITSIFAFWIDREDPHHYWKLIAAGWFIAILGAFPTLSLIWGSDGIWAFGVLLAFPALAHLYGFIANVKTLRNPENAGRTGPALVGATYIAASLIGMTQIEPLLAVVLPLSAVIMAVLTFGIAFTGFAPLLGMVIIFFLLRHSLNRINIGAAAIIMTAAWLLSLATGWFLGNL